MILGGSAVQLVNRHYLCVISIILVSGRSPYVERKKNMEIFHKLLTGTQRISLYTAAWGTFRQCNVGMIPELVVGYDPG